MAQDQSSRLLSLAPQLGTLAVVLAVAAAFIPSTSNSTKPQTGVATAPDPAAAAAEPVTAEQSFAKFLHDADLISKESKRPELLDTFANNTLIATLPDPVGTDFGYWFDQCIESLSRAMADSDADGYGLERYWYPWLAPTSSGKPDNFNWRVGLLVFRKFKDPMKRRVVLIVVENALSGVKMETMHAALNMVPKANGQRNIRILGPAFSGSQPSILDALARWDYRGEANVAMLSGSAIGIKTVSQLVGAEKPATASLTIRSTHAHIKTQMNAMLHYLASPGDTRPTDEFTRMPDLKQVAFLIESNSGFGTAAVNAAKMNPGDNPWILRFPLHISKLTAILSAEQRERDERLGLGTHGGTLITLDEARGKRDLVPATDELRTAELNKRLLDDYCAVLRRERVRFIGILATDPRDKLYLFEMLQRQCPNARLFTHGADNHFVHPAYYRPMRGVLLVSTYALVPQSQQWTRVWQKEEESRRLPFPSTYSQGLYNATLAQLGADKMMLDYRPPAFSHPEDPPPTQPPLWISTVGETGKFVPLAYFVNAKEGEKTSRWGPDSELTYDLPKAVVDEEAAVRREALKRGEDAATYAPPALEKLAFAMVAVLAFAVFAAFAIRRAYSTDLRLAVFNPYRPMGLRDWYTALVGIGLMIAVTPFAIYFHTVYHYGRFDHFLVSMEYPLDGLLFVLVILVGLCAPALLVFTVLPLLSWVTGRFEKESTPCAKLPRWRRFLSIAVAGLTLLLTLGLYLKVYGEGHPDPGQMLFLERAADLFGGSSAILPCLFIALGVAGFGILGFRLLDLRTRFKVDCPYPTADDQMPPATEPTGLALRRIRTGTATLEDELWQTATMRHRWVLYLIASGAGLSFAVPSYFNAFRTWDGRFWDVLFVLGFSALAAFATVSLFRFVMLWRYLELILRGVAGVPMVGAFDRLPLRTSGMLARFLMAGRRRSSDLAVPLRLLDELRASPETPWLEPCRPVLDRAATLDDVSAKDDPDITGMQASRLSLAAQALVVALMPEWSKKNVCDAFGTKPSDKDEPPCGPQAVAEQFIAVQAVIFVSQYFTQLRYFAYMAACSAGCLLFALTDYPFEPEHLVMFSGVGLVLAVVCVVVWGLIQINKNEIVSRVTRTTPGRLSLDSAPMVMNAVTLIGPLLVVVLVQASGRLRSVIEPVVGLFR